MEGSRSGTETDAASGSTAFGSASHADGGFPLATTAIGYESTGSNGETTNLFYAFPFGSAATSSVVFIPVGALRLASL